MVRPPATTPINDLPMVPYSLASWGTGSRGGSSDRCSLHTVKNSVTTTSIHDWPKGQSPCKNAT